MFKVTIDTNVWLSGFASTDSPPAEIVSKALAKRLHPVLSTVILDEIERNLVGKFGVQPKAARRLIYRIAQVSDLYEPSGQVKLSGISAADCLVLETAWIGKARYLVTGDKRLLELKHFHLTRIIEPVHFCKLLVK